MEDPVNLCRMYFYLDEEVMSKVVDRNMTVVGFIKSLNLELEKGQRILPVQMDRESKVVKTIIDGSNCLMK